MDLFGTLIHLVNLAVGVLLIIALIQAIRYLTRKLKQ